MACALQVDTMIAVLKAAHMTCRMAHSCSSDPEQSIPAGCTGQTTTSIRGLHGFPAPSPRAISALSSTDIGQCSSQLLQYASISAPALSNCPSSSRVYPDSTRSWWQFGHSDENGLGLFTGFPFPKTFVLIPIDG
jgi:hypothetical protein